MRLGHLFSRVLDPDKAPLFGGEADGVANGDGSRTPFDLSVLPEERWEACPTGRPPPIPLSLHKGFMCAPGSGTSSGESSQVVVTPPQIFPFPIFLFASEYLTILRFLTPCGAPGL